MTDEGAISVDTLIKDVIITPIDRTSWANSLKSPHITSLQLADDFQSDPISCSNSYWYGYSVAVPET